MKIKFYTLLATVAIMVSNQANAQQPKQAAKPKTNAVKPKPKTTITKKPIVKK